VLGERYIVNARSLEILHLTVHYQDACTLIYLYRLLATNPCSSPIAIIVDHPDPPSYLLDHTSLQTIQLLFNYPSRNYLIPQDGAHGRRSATGGLPTQTHQLHQPHAMSVGSKEFPEVP
jgi:hypothetical protein